MKKETKKTKQQLLNLFYKASREMSEENYAKSEHDFGKLLALLPFKDALEKRHYLDLYMSFKFWEDLEKETIRIINNLY